MKPTNTRFAFIVVAIALLVVSVAPTTTSAAEAKKCSTNSECAKGEFCDTTPKCPGGDTTGMCASKPQMCTMDYVPVTGCNGKEYTNRCVAAADGQPNTGAVKAK